MAEIKAWELNGVPMIAAALAVICQRIEQLILGRFSGTGRSNSIKQRKLKYSICCLRDVTLKKERDLSNRIKNSKIQLGSPCMFSACRIGRQPIATLTVTFQGQKRPPKLENKSNVNHLNWFRR